MRVVEELLLLLFDEQQGDLSATSPPTWLGLLLAGAVLMDLALENRIDSDLKQLMLVDPNAVGDDLLDPALADIAQASESQTIDYWVRRHAAHGSEIREQALRRLAESGILETYEASASYFLSRRVSRERRYRVAGRAELQEEVRLRVMRVLFSDDIPDPRDAVIICLADAGGVFERVLSTAELDEVRDRVDLLSRLDLIGQSVARAVREAEAEVVEVPAPRGRDDIPCARGLPLVGNAISMHRDLNAFLLGQYRELGPVFRVRALNRHFIVLAGAEANQLMDRRSVHFRTRESWQAFDAEIGAMRQIMSMGGPEHHRMRQFQASPYSRGVLKDGLDEVIRIVRSDVANWPADEPIPAQYTCQRITLEQLGRLATGMSTGEYVDDFIAYFEALLKVYMARSHPRLMLRSPRLRQARRRVMELADRIRDDHDPMRRRGKAPDYIDEVLALHRADPEFLPETDVPITILGPFLVGLDTASTMTAFMLYEILSQPDLLERMRAEVDALFGRGIPDYSDLHQLDVTRRIAMETFRLYPLGAALPRIVANSFEFKGYRVPAGEQVLVGYSLPHRMAEFFPDPGRFDIDRYSPQRAEHRQPGAYAPFGLGSHSCLGRGLAEALVMINAAVIVHETDLELDPPGYVLKVKRRPALHPDRSFRFRLMRRRT